MATDLEARPVSKPDAFLERKFHELCARIRWVDRLAHVLTLLLIVVAYAALRVGFDWSVGGSQSTWILATRWIGFALFLVCFVGFCVRAVRGWFRAVNPYYVAHLLEETIPGAKNSLINWLDLHDEDLPSAFHKYLSARAAEQWQEGDPRQTIRTGKNWALLGILGVPLFALLVLIAVSPSSAFGSLVGAFFPFVTPARVAQTEITLIEPNGDAEVNPTQTVVFRATIRGRIPAPQWPGEPKLLYRYHGNEDNAAVPLARNDAGEWTAQLSAHQLRTGFTYKLCAGDAETAEHRIRVRGRAHVKKFDIAYDFPASLQHKKATATFPNAAAARPLVHGLRGTKVELTLHASQPIREARVEVTFAKGKRDLPARVRADGSTAVVAFTLEDSGQFRVLFTTNDSEENADRDLYPIDVRIDETPTVVLTQPGKDITIPANGFVELTGRASDDLGVKSLTLHVRVAKGPDRNVKLEPLPYRAGKSLASEDGSYPEAIEFDELLVLEQLKDERGTLRRFAPGTTLEYWVEAVDHAEPANVGKSAVYKLTLTPAVPDAKAKVALNDAMQRQKEQQKKHDEKRKQQSDDRKKNASSNPEQDLAAVNKEKQAAEDKIRQAMKEQQDNANRGGAKGAEPPQAGQKEGPNPESEGPQAGQKDQPPMPGESGASKPGGKDGSQARDDGDGKKKGEPSSTGNAKPQPKSADSAAKDGGDKKMDAGAGSAKDGSQPPPSEPRDNAGAGDAPARAKAGEPALQQHGDAKGIEQQGPETPSKGTPTPPDAHAKADTKPDGAGEPKQGGGAPGQARDDAPAKDRAPSWDDVRKLHGQLEKGGPDADAAGVALAVIGKGAPDPRMRDAAQEALTINGRDPKTGQETKKGKNASGTLGKFEGMSDEELKATIANRAFAARLGQLQLNDWKKQLTPELLQKAGMTEADWQRYLKSMQAHDALVRQLNAKLLRDRAKLLSGGQAPLIGPRTVEGAAPNEEALDRGLAVPPPELSDAVRRFNERRAKQ